MCGICGFYSKKRKLGKETLEKMNKAQAHRGPDDSGTFFDQGVGLGHKRLSVIDLSSRAHQPMFNEDRSLAVVFNGTIFNFQELREQLLEKGHGFQSQSDTEVLLHLYEEEREGLLEKLKGQFAFALWDGRERRLMLARDRLGIKPLYFAFRDETLLFASEARTLPVSGALPRELDQDGLVSFLECNSVSPPLTIFRGVETLPAGHFLIFDGEEVRVRRYWDVVFPAKKDRGDFEESKRELREALFQSVESMLVGDVPVGVFLSGGIDSSVIAGILRKLGRRDVEAFSIVFQEAEYSELPYARKVAEHNNLPFHSLEISASDLMRELPNMIRAMDQPTGDGLNTYLVSRHTKKRVTVALSGLGGDELFFGYHLFRMIPRILSLTRPLFRLPPLLRRRAYALARGLTPMLGLNARLPEVLNGPDPFSAAYRSMRMIFSEDIIRKSIDAPSRERFPFRDLLADCVKKGAHLQHREAVSYLELKNYMQNTLLRDSDIMAMAHALEVRFPLLDEGIVDLALQMPARAKEGKGIFIESVKDLLPEEVRTRRKMGFSFPIPVWMKGPLKPWIIQRLSPERIGRYGVFNPQVVSGLVRNFYHGGRADFRMVWSIFIFDLWHQVHIEGKDLDMEPRPAGSH